MHYWSLDTADSLSVTLLLEWEMTKLLTKSLVLFFLTFSFSVNQDLSTV